jgi:hypothetical protein
MTLAVCAEADGSRDVESAIVPLKGLGPCFGQRALCLRRPECPDEGGKLIMLGTINTVCVHADWARLDLAAMHVPDAFFIGFRSRSRRIDA